MARLLALAAVLGLALPAAAQPRLFDPAGAARAALTPRQATLLGHLEAIAAAEARLVGVSLHALEAGAVAFDLAPEASVTLTRERTEWGAGGAAYYFRSEADDGTFATLVARRGQLTGNVRVAGRLYAVRPLTGGLHAVARVDERRFVDHPPEWAAVEAAAASGPGAGPLVPESDPLALLRDAPRDVPVVQRVLVPYSVAAASEVADIHALIQLALFETNLGYERSAVGLRLVLALAYQTPQDETKQYWRTLHHLATAADGLYDDVFDRQARYGADLVVMIVRRNEPHCGLAQAILAAGPADAFAVTSHVCATGYYTFGHELGHLQGARHNPEIDNALVPFSYGHGNAYEPGHWRTVMAYDCLGGCAPILHWSNPRVTYNGVRTGDWTRRDNARVLGATAAYVAAFLPEPAEGGATASVVWRPGSPGEGRVRFDATVAGTGAAGFDGAVWVTATLPSGKPVGPLFGPVHVRLGEGEAVTRTLQVRVPERAPPGTYRVALYAGRYPDVAVAADFFSFPHSPAGGVQAGPPAGAGVAPWQVTDVTDQTPAAMLAGSPAAAIPGVPPPAGLTAYPSPFRAAARVRYTVANAGPVRLAVYDLLGREVAVLVDGPVAAGTHEAGLDGRGLPSGTYLARLAAGGAVQTLRLTRAR